MKTDIPTASVILRPDLGPIAAGPGWPDRCPVHNNGDSITILRAHSRRLAKLILPDGTIEGYDHARTFDLIPHPVTGLGDVFNLLSRLVHRHDCAVVRGEPCGPVGSRGVRRLLFADAKTGDAATLREAPRRWLALDMEGIPLPANVPASDLSACAALALTTLPSPFAGADCIVQASGSHGFKPDLRLRLWFWCDRALSGAELRRWLHGTPADPSVFSGAQVIYTAAPVILCGRPDPLPVRLLRLTGGGDLRCPSPAALAPPPRPPAHSVTVNSRGASAYARAALVGAARRILSADKRHPCILGEARGLARLVFAGVLSEPDMRRTLHAAAACRGKPADEVEAVIAWALDNSSRGIVLEACHG